MQPHVKRIKNCQKFGSPWCDAMTHAYTTHTHTTYSLATTGVPRADKFGSPWDDAMAHIHMYTTLTHIHTPIQHSCTSPQACRHTDIHTCIIGRIGVNELGAYMHTHTQTQMLDGVGATHIYTQLIWPCWGRACFVPSVWVKK